MSEDSFTPAPVRSSDFRLSERSAAADLEACQRILAAGSKSFAAASLLLPRRMRAPAAAFYAFCRIADDLVDYRFVRRALEKYPDWMKDPSVNPGDPFNRDEVVSL